MTNGFKKLRLQQVQDKLSPVTEIANQPIPRRGWINTIREALGISSRAMAKMLNCSQANIIAMENRERKKNISLATLEQAAQVMGCKLVYYFVPLEPLNKIVENQARKVAREKISLVNHSMKLEQQGLNKKQIQQQEEDLVEELLQGNPKKLWNDE